MIASRDQRSRASASAWPQPNRLGIAVLLSVVWMAVTFLIVQDAVVAVICGIVVAVILAMSLPRPPAG